MQALRAVLAAGHEVDLVLSDGVGTGATAAGEAAQQGIGVEPAGAVKEPALAERLRAGGVDLLLNVHSLHVVHADVLAAPRIGSFNLHPGPLPEYAGLNVPSWAIYLGEERHGVTLHWMEPEVDAGAIAYESRFDIGPEDTGLTVSARCVKEGIPLVERLLEDAPRGTIPRTEQDLSRRRWFGREPPHGGALPFELPARQLVDLVRASDYSPFPSPWGHPSARLDDREVRVIRATTTGLGADDPPGMVGRQGAVAAADEWVALERILVDGERADPGEILHPGMRFGVLS